MSEERALDKGDTKEGKHKKFKLKTQESLRHNPDDFQAFDEDEEAPWPPGCCCCGWAICCCCRWIWKCCDIVGYWSGLKCCCCHYKRPKHQLYIEPNENRHCTDVPCLLLLILTLAVDLAIIVTAIDIGDPRWFLVFVSSLHVPVMYVGAQYRLVYYSDYNGTICAPGEDKGEFAAWPDIRLYDVRICVQHCNDTVDDPRIVTPSFSSNLESADFSSVGDISGYETVTC